MDYKPDLSPEQKLDVVLQKVVNTPISDNLNFGIIANVVGASEYTKEIFEILLKLLKDGYIRGTNDSGHGNYVSNFDGRMFIDKGGYTAKALRDAAIAEQQRIDAARLIDLENQNLTSSGLLNTLTGRLVRATWFAVGAAAVLFLWNMWIWFYPVHNDYPYWFWEKVPTKTSPKKL